jgi:hypothetical protein
MHEQGNPDRHGQAREALREAVSQLMDGDGFKRWVEVRSRFRRYSFGNCLLIAMQRPDATHVAGYRAWQGLDRQVRRGERAIRILAPIVVKRKDANGDGERAVVGFRSVSVFDVAQTDGDPLPEPPACVPHDGDDLGHYLGALEGHARTLGYVVYRYRPEGGALGYCDPIGKRIVIDSELSPNAQVSTLVHELAHAHGLGYREHGRERCEVIVEASTAIVLGALGFDPARFSVPYIAGWAKDAEGLKALQAFATVIDSTARKIEAALGLGSTDG